MSHAAQADGTQNFEPVTSNPVRAAESQATIEAGHPSMQATRADEPEP